MSGDADAILGLLATVIGLVTAHASRKPQQVIHRSQKAYRFRSSPPDKAKDPSEIRQANTLAWPLARFLGFGLFGVGGGALGWILLPSAPEATVSPGTLGAAAGLGTCVAGAICFAIAAAAGHVILGDLIGEMPEAGEGKRPVWASFSNMILEGFAGAAWGSVLGMAIGLLGGLLVAGTGLVLNGILGSITAGAMGGAALGLIVAVISYHVSDSSAPR